MDKEAVIKENTPPEGMRNLTNEEWRERTKDGTVPLTPENRFAKDLNIFESAWEYGKNAVSDLFGSKTAEDATKVAKDNPSWFDKVVDRLGEGLGDAFDKALPAAIEAGIMYTGSRLLGYNDYDSFSYATKVMKTRMEEKRKSEITTAVKRQEKALEMLSEGKISPAEYAAIVSGDMTLAQAFAGTGSESASSSLEFKRAVQRLGGKADNEPKRVVVTAGNKMGETGRIVQAYAVPEGWAVLEGDKVKIYDPSSAEEYSGDFHSVGRVQEEIMNKVVPMAKRKGYISDLSVTGKDGDNKTTERKEQQMLHTDSFVNSIIQHAKLKYGNRADIMLNTSAGMNYIEKYMDAAVAYRQNTKKTVENYEGLFSAIDASIIGGDGKPRLPTLNVDDKKKYIVVDKHLDVAAAAQKQPKDALLGKAIEVFGSTDTSKYSVEVKNLLAKYRSKDYTVPKGSTAQMEFAIEFLKLLSQP